MNILKVENLKKSYQVRGGERTDRTEVLKGISFEIDEKEFVAIMGRSGGGKTTLLKVLGMIEYATEGKLFFKGEDTDYMKSNDMDDLRRNGIGYIFQDYYLLDSLTVRENMVLPMALDNADPELMEQKAEEYAAHYNMTHLLDKKPCDLSGGEKQRVAICRALIHNPDLILADEPTGNLDSKSGKVVIDALMNINENDGKTILMVTHDPKMASYCNRVIFFKDGLILDEIHKTGDRESFFHQILDKMEEI